MVFSFFVTWLSNGFFFEWEKEMSSTLNYGNRRWIIERQLPHSFVVFCLSPLNSLFSMSIFFFFFASTKFHKINTFTLYFDMNYIPIFRDNCFLKKKSRFKASVIWILLQIDRYIRDNAEHTRILTATSKCRQIKNEDRIS